MDDSAAATAAYNPHEITKPIPDNRSRGLFHTKHKQILAALPSQGIRHTNSAQIMAYDTCYRRTGLD